MLVLSRKPGEHLKIGKAGDVLSGPIVVTCVQITPGRTRLGVQAPSDIGIHRQELVPREEAGSHNDGGGEQSSEDLGSSVLAKRLRGEEE